MPRSPGVPPSRRRDAEPPPARPWWDPGLRSTESSEARRSRRKISISTQASSESGPTGARRGLILALATAGGAGYAPLAPGTAGSAVGVAAFALLVPFGTASVLGVATVLLAVGIWAANHAERIFERKDDGRIVIDEVVGQLLALAPLAAMAPAVRPRSPWLLAAGFLLFRLFDIWKPGPVRLADTRNKPFEKGAGCYRRACLIPVMGPGCFRV